MHCIGLLIGLKQYPFQVFSIASGTRVTNLLGFPLTVPMLPLKGHTSREVPLYQAHRSCWSPNLAHS